MRRKLLTLKNALIATCACGLAVIAVVTATMIAGLGTSEASISFGDTTQDANYGRYFVGGNSNGTSQTNAQPLFGKDGISPDTASELMKVIKAVRPSGTANKTAADFSSFVNTKVNKQGAVYVRLFEPMTGTSNAAYFTTSKATAEGETGKARWWRVVHLQGDILTLWMAEAYRNSAFGGGYTYQGSTIQTNLNDDFIGVYLRYNDRGKDAIDATIVTTTPYSIVETTGNGAGTASYFSNPTGSDKVWIPTGYEIFNVANNTTDYGTGTAYSTIRAGYWQVNGMDRAYQYSAGDVLNHAWIRSKYLNHPFGNGVVYNDGYCWHAYTYERAVRPALHINLAEVRKVLPSSIVAEVE